MPALKLDTSAISIRNLERSLENFKPSAEDVRKFCKAVKDTNPGHQNLNAALEMGFEGIPVPGTYGSAFGEKISQALAKEAAEQSSVQVYVLGQNTKFSKAIYIGEPLTPQIGRCHISHTPPFKGSYLSSLRP